MTSVNVASHLAQMAATSPDRVAVREPHARGRKSMTFRELHEESDALAHGLGHLGIGAQSRAALMVPPTLEFFLKNDALHDPMINEYHIRTFGWASDAEVAIMKDLTFRANHILKTLFANAGILLVDYKLEFGRFNGTVILGDEFSPDGCRLWDATTRKKLDKDRFRQDLGDVIEGYEEVARRLGVEL